MNQSAIKQLQELSVQSSYFTILHNNTVISKKNSNDRGRASEEISYFTITQQNVVILESTYQPQNKHLFQHLRFPRVYDVQSLFLLDRRDYRQKQQNTATQKRCSLVCVI